MQQNLDTWELWSQTKMQFMKKQRVDEEWVILTNIQLQNPVHV
jgi:hypothetical protein